MVLDTVIFYTCAIFAVGGAVMMILQRNPVASVLYMIVSLIAQAVLYVQLSALFVGALLNCLCRSHSGFVPFCYHDPEPAGGEV